MSILLTSCSCVHRIALDQNVILITLIVCCTLLAAIAISLLFLYFKSNKRIALEKEKRKLEEGLSKKADELLKEKERNKEVDSTLLNEEKKKKEFLDYCYTMAKSLEEDNKEQRNDCWKILLHFHANCIPDELKVPTEKEKREKDFLDYCYKMLEKGNDEEKKECWKILLHFHANCIPDELKQEYNVGNNVVENAGKTE